MKYDVIIVGGGISGLTAAAYLSKEGYKTLVCEKEDKVGGLVNSFKYKGYTFDGGIRSIENSGIVLPMLRQLGLNSNFLDSVVSVGIDKSVINVESKQSLEDYEQLLVEQFPNNEKDIENILKEVKKIMKYLDILYGIDNPVFLDFKKDKKYLLTTILPWVFKFMFTYRKINSLNMPVDEYLHEFTENQALIDLIGQHFFYKTPAFFALSYFSLYLDYKYPKGGTGNLIKTMEDFILENNADIRTNTEITYVDPNLKIAKDNLGNEYSYKKMIWASDIKSLYKLINIESLDDKTKSKILKRTEDIEDKIGGDSIVTVYLGADINKEYFKDICTGHFFYTPNNKGLNENNNKKATLNLSNKDEVIEWMKEYYENTTYEISIPSLRDESLTPEGKTGLVVSVLMDYSLVKEIENNGWYDEFKKLSEELTIDALNNSIFPGLKEKVEFKFSSTPITIQKRTNNSDGAITGWAFTNKPIPAVTSMTNVTKSVLTPLPNIYQSGQWSYSPSGLPISILTGKIAADTVLKKL